MTLALDDIIDQLADADTPEQVVSGLPEESLETLSFGLIGLAQSIGIENVGQRNGHSPQEWAFHLIDVIQTKGSAVVEEIQTDKLRTLNEDVGIWQDEDNKTTVGGSVKFHSSQKREDERHSTTLPDDRTHFVRLELFIERDLGHSLNSPEGRNINAEAEGLVARPKEQIYFRESSLGFSDALIGFYGQNGDAGIYLDPALGEYLAAEGIKEKPIVERRRYSQVSISNFIHDHLRCENTPENVSAITKYLEGLLATPEEEIELPNGKKAKARSLVNLDEDGISVDPKLAKSTVDATGVIIPLSNHNKLYAYELLHGELFSPRDALRGIWGINPSHIDVVRFQEHLLTCLEANPDQVIDDDGTKISDVIIRNPNIRYYSWDMFVAEDALEYLGEQYVEHIEALDTAQEDWLSASDVLRELSMTSYPENLAAVRLIAKEVWDQQNEVKATAKDGEEMTERVKLGRKFSGQSLYIHKDYVGADRIDAIITRDKVREKIIAQATSDQGVKFKLHTIKSALSDKYGNSLISASEYVRKYQAKRSGVSDKASRFTAYVEELIAENPDLLVAEDPTLTISEAVKIVNTSSFGRVAFVSTAAEDYFSRNYLSVIADGEHQWVKGKDVCEHFGINPSPENITAANQLIAELYSVREGTSAVFAGKQIVPFDEIVVWGVKGGNEGHYIRLDALENTEPALMAATTIKAVAQAGFVEQRSIMSPEEVVRAVRGIGSVISDQDIIDLRDYLSTRLLDDPNQVIDEVNRTTISEVLPNWDGKDQNLIISNTLVPFLRRNYLSPLPEDRSKWLTGASLCREMNLQTGHTNAANQILRRIWLQGPETEIELAGGETAKVKSILGRHQNGRSVGYYINPDYVGKAITEEQIRAKKQGKKDVATKLPESRSHWLTGSMNILVELNLSNHPSYTAATKQILEELYAQRDTLSVTLITGESVEEVKLSECMGKHLSGTTPVIAIDPRLIAANSDPQLITADIVKAKVAKNTGNLPPVPTAREDWLYGIKLTEELGWSHSTDNVAATEAVALEIYEEIHAAGSIKIGDEAYHATEIAEKYNYRGKEYAYFNPTAVGELITHDQVKKKKRSLAGHENFELTAEQQDWLHDSKAICAEVGLGIEKKAAATALVAELYESSAELVLNHESEELPVSENIVKFIKGNGREGLAVNPQIVGYDVDPPIITENLILAKVAELEGKVDKLVLRAPPDRKHWLDSRKILEKLDLEVTDRNFSTTNLILNDLFQAQAAEIAIGNVIVLQGENIGRYASPNGHPWIIMDPEQVGTLITTEIINAKNIDLYGKQTEELPAEKENWYTQALEVCQHVGVGKVHARAAKELLEELYERREQVNFTRTDDILLIEGMQNPEPEICNLSDHIGKYKFAKTADRVAIDPAILGYDLDPPLLTENMILLRSHINKGGKPEDFVPILPANRQDWLPVSEAVGAVGLNKTNGKYRNALKAIGEELLEAGKPVTIDGTEYPIEDVICKYMTTKGAVIHFSPILTNNIITAKDVKERATSPDAVKELPTEKEEWIRGAQHLCKELHIAVGPNAKAAAEIIEEVMKQADKITVKLADGTESKLSDHIAKHKKGNNKFIVIDPQILGNDIEPALFTAAKVKNRTLENNGEKTLWCPDERKDWLFGQAILDQFGYASSGDYRSALEAVLDEIYESKRDETIEIGGTPTLIGDLMERYLTGRTEAIHIDPRAVGELVTKEMVSAKVNSRGSFAEDIPANKKDWVKGFRGTCAKCKLDTNKANVNAAERVITNLYKNKQDMEFSLTHPDGRITKERLADHIGFFRVEENGSTFYALNPLVIGYNCEPEIINDNVILREEAKERGDEENFIPKRPPHRKDWLPVMKVISQLGLKPYHRVPLQEILEKMLDERNRKIEADEKLEGQDELLCRYRNGHPGGGIYISPTLIGTVITRDAIEQAHLDSLTGTAPEPGSPPRSSSPPAAILERGRSHVTANGPSRETVNAESSASRI